MLAVFETRIFTSPIYGSWIRKIMLAGSIGVPSCLVKRNPLNAVSFMRICQELSSEVFSANQHADNG